MRFFLIFLCLVSLVSFIFSNATGAQSTKVFTADFISKTRGLDAITTTADLISKRSTV